LSIYNSQNSETSAIIYNDNAGTSAEAVFYVGNGNAGSTSTFLGTTGTGFTTASGFVQDAGYIGSGTGLSGGLSIMTRANADMRFYTNGHTNERMRIDASGRVTKPYQPAFRAYRSTDPGVNTSNGNMSWTATEFNVGNHFANNRFTAPVAGTYIFGVNNNMGSGDSVSSWQLYKNGSQYHVLSYSDFTASWKNSSGSSLMQLQANDYIEAWWRGDADYGVAWCGFYGYLIG
jgi:hypothetical protein